MTQTARPFGYRALISADHNREAMAWLVDNGYRTMEDWFALPCGGQSQYLFIFDDRDLQTFFQLKWGCDPVQN